MKNQNIHTIALAAFLCFSAAVAHAQINNGLVVHLTFDGTNASGNYTNTIANGIEGVPVGTPYFTNAPGAIGNGAVSLTTRKDGSEISYVTLGYPTELQFGAVRDNTDSDFSIAFWCNYTNQIDDPGFIACQNWGSSNNRGWGIYCQGSGNFRVVTTDDQGSAGKQSTTLANPAGLLRGGTWHHVVVTWARRGNVSFYKDGALLGSASLGVVTGPIDTPDLGYNVNIGEDGTGSYTDGGSAEIVNLLMDDLGIWRRVLSLGEILAIYNAGLGGTNLSKVPAVVNPFVKSTTPAVKDTGVRPDATVSAVMTDGLNAVATNSVKLFVNGAQVAASVTKAGVDTTVQFTPTAIWPVGLNTATLIFGNNAAPQQLFTNTWTYSVAAYVTLTPNLKVSPNTSKPGFAWKIFANSANTTANNARAEAALAGMLLDVDGVTPLPNVADPNAQGVALATASAPSPSNASLKFEIPGVLNLDSYAGSTGNFTPDGQMPGLPATDSTTDGVAAEAITYLQLPAGLVVMGVNSDDGFSTSAGLAPQDAFHRVTVGEYDAARAPSDTLFYLAVQEAGVYAFRTLWENATSGANIEWFTVNGTNKVLLNDLANGGATAYRAVSTPVPPYIKYVSPAPVLRQFNQTSTNLVIVLADGDTAINDTSVVLKLDGAVVTPVKSRAGSSLTLTYTPTTLQFPVDPHQAELTFSNVGGSYSRTERWSFCNLLNLVLPAPVVSDNFDSYAEGSVPTGWVGKNFTDCSAGYCATPGLDLDNLDSDSYRGWVVVSRSRLAGLKAGIFNCAPGQTSNGVPITVEELCQGNLIYAESDSRDGNQVQFLTSKPFNLSSVANPALSFSSLYEQNQDSSGAVEYSVDGGTNWLPVVYYLDSIEGGGDIRLNADGSVDAVTTFTADNGDTAAWTDAGVIKGGRYGDGIAAPITQALGRFVAPRINDNSTIDKRLEIYRLPAAAHKADVRLRFAQLGTGSWYFGVDNVAFYDVAAPPASKLTITTAGSSATLYWTGIGTLQQAPAVTGPWTPATSQANPQTVPLSSSQKYWRIGPP
jgi:hypothetical protein